MSTALTDDERAIFVRRLGAARVELLPCYPDVPKGERRFWIFARCYVGDWSKELQVRHVRRIDTPSEMRTGALDMLAHGFQIAAPHLFPVRP